MKPDRRTTFAMVRVVVWSICATSVVAWGWVGYTAPEVQAAVLRLWSLCGM